MPECARCGAFTPSTDGETHYCSACRARFEKVREEGVIVEKPSGPGDYRIGVTADGTKHEWATAATQVEALAWGRYLCEKLGVEGLFHYHGSGSQWLLDEYLRAHPQIRQDVHAEANRLPEGGDGALREDVRTVI